MVDLGWPSAHADGRVYVAAPGSSTVHAAGRGFLADLARPGSCCPGFRYINA